MEDWAAVMMRLVNGYSAVRGFEEFGRKEYLR